MVDDGIEWELEDLDGGVLYDVFYESTTMLAGRMLAQRRLAAARGDRDGERRAEGTGMGCWPPATRWVRRTGGP